VLEVTVLGCVGAIATILSIVGGTLVASTNDNVQVKGYYLWFVSNLMWVGYFIYNRDVWPFILYALYFTITVLALRKRMFKKIKEL